MTLLIFVIPPLGGGVALPALALAFGVCAVVAVVAAWKRRGER